MLSRRKALFGLLAAPAIIKTAGLLMPIKPLIEIEWLDTSWKGGWSMDQEFMEWHLEQIAKACGIPKHLMLGATYA